MASLTVTVVNPATGESAAVSVPFLTGPPPVLPIPARLSGSWTAPPGTWLWPSKPSTVAAGAPLVVDLSSVTLVTDTGYSGYLLAPDDGADVIVGGGTVVMARTVPAVGLVSLSTGTTRVAVHDLTSQDALRSLIFSKSYTSMDNLSVLSNVTATSLGSGIRACGSMFVSDSKLIGGGAPPNANPAGVHSGYDVTKLVVSYPGSFVKVARSTITGFTSAGFQGDAVPIEYAVARADITDSVLGWCTDGAVDSKCVETHVSGCTIHGQGSRSLASHIGTLYSTGNTIFQVACSAAGAQGAAYQASGRLIAAGDTVVLEPGALLAHATVSRSGSGDPSTFPRVGWITVTGAIDAAGRHLLGPVKVDNDKQYTPKVEVF